MSGRACHGQDRCRCSCYASSSGLGEPVPLRGRSHDHAVCPRSSSSAECRSLVSAVRPCWPPEYQRVHEVQTMMKPQQQLATRTAWSLRRSRSAPDAPRNLDSRLRLKPARHWPPTRVEKSEASAIAQATVGSRMARVHQCGQRHASPFGRRFVIDSDG